MCVACLPVNERTSERAREFAYQRNISYCILYCILTHLCEHDPFYLIFGEQTKKTRNESMEKKKESGKFSIFAFELPIRNEVFNICISLRYLCSVFFWRANPRYVSWCSATDRVRHRWSTVASTRVACEHVNSGNLFVYCARACKTPFPI